MKKIFFALVCFVAITGAFSAQTTGAPTGFPDYFPEAAEIAADSRTFVSGFDDAAGLAKIANGRLAADVGFVRYERADYSGATPLSIEVFTLLDFKAAYSLLTLLRENPVQPGPPGDSFTAADNAFLFVHGRFFVRVIGKGASKELLEKSAVAIGAKMTPSRGERPELLDYFPAGGYDAAGLRYFPSPDAYKTWTNGKIPGHIDTNYDMEIAMARYFAESGSGTIYLLKFPTPELAEEYYDELTVSAPAVPNGLSIYARRIGPLIACLEGNFDPVSAGELLSTVNFSYSMRWVYGDENNVKVVWGIPGVVLSAVVNSLIFSALAVVAAVLVGLAAGIGLFMLRQYKIKRSPNPLEEDPGFTRLDLR
ncbi:MAG: hypothetical protein LBJ21_04630 [Acidobacteriota bacterium]|jgi:hypothetical protein|nr:hypothetical protein [Acidobacteriota bacterium]